MSENSKIEWPVTNMKFSKAKGTSVENQEQSEIRIPDLLRIPAKVHWLICEPLLGEINLTAWIGDIDWVIVGGESGPNARPMHPDWVWDLHRECLGGAVPFFFKGWGEWYPVENGRIPALNNTRIQQYPITIIDRKGKPQMKYWDHENVLMVRVGKKNAGRLLDRKEYSQFPTSET